ncbi:MAG TPA: complex I subunit 1 family protein [Polyangiaceae bacterium]|nr:complex I subunit 1 family protein [Polyangiaceae bacterium]
MNIPLPELGIFLLRAFVVVMFAMNVAVLLTWADRRQGAAIQDRVGPNRAVIWIPTPIAQALALLPALGLAGGVLLLLAKHDFEGPMKPFAAAAFSHLAILWVWLTGLIIAGLVAARGARNSFDVFIASIGNPRRFFYAGFAAHLILFAATLMYRGTEQGALLEQLGLSAFPAMFAFAVVAGAGYAAFSIRKEPRVGLRLVGLLHPAADGLKTIFKEDFIPPNADKFLHSIAPIIAFFPALVVLGVVPFGSALCFGTNPETGRIAFDKLYDVLPAAGCTGEGMKQLPLQVVGLDVGVLYFFALAGTGIVGAALAGWASDNKYSLLGGLRAASQMVSYEVTMGLTLVGVFMLYGTLRVDEMVRWQAENTWGIFLQPVAFVLFFAAAVAESKRIPFDIPEGESEIVAGYYTEYAGMKFAMFFFAEYIAVVTSSALMAALFLGGWDLPFIRHDGLHIAIGQSVFVHEELPHVLVVVLGALGFVLKTVTLCWLQLTIRWTLPRFRYDQLMRLGWRKLLPASLVNILVTGVLILAVQGAGESVLHGLETAAAVTKLLIAVAGIAGVVALVLFLLRPVKKRRMLATTSAQFGATLGGTQQARMEA